MGRNLLVQKRLDKASDVLAAVGVEKTIFPSPAGKKRIAAKLAKLLPPHETYVEPFAGSAAVFFAKAPAKVEVLSDGNTEIAKAYARLKALKPEGVELLKQKDWIGSRETFKQVKELAPENDVDALYKFLYLRKFSFGKFDKTMDPFREGRSSHVFHRIAQYGPRLKNARIFSGDYEKVVRKFDSPTTAFFLDPPYPGYDAHVGESAFDEDRFLNLCKSLKGKALITYGIRGKFPAAIKQLDGWVVKKIRPVRLNTGKLGNRGAKRLEQLVAMNYELTRKALDGLGVEFEDVSLAELEKAAKPIEKADAVKVVDFQGIPVHIDRPAGFKQTGVDDTGKAWERVYQNDYGFIEKTEGGDGEELDVFMGPDATAETTYWVSQNKADGTFDEYKVFLGFPSQEHAVATYKAHIPERFMGAVSAVPVSHVKALCGVHPGPVQKSFSKTSKILKGVDQNDERYVLGIVLEPEVVDAQGDIYSAEEIRNACHLFMEDYGGLGLQHQIRVNGKVKLLENYIAPADFSFGEVTVKRGTWLMAVRVLDDEMWAACKDGALTGFSIGGSARKVPEPSATQGESA